MLRLPARKRPREVRAGVPAAPATADLDDLLADDGLDAVVLATPVPTHAELRSACSTPASTASSRSRSAVGRGGRARVEAARRNDRILMVGHLLQYHPGVVKLKALAESGELGDIHYIYGKRLNLGRLRADENALWAWGRTTSRSCSSWSAGSPPDPGPRRGVHAPAVEDVVFCLLRFPSGLVAHLHLSWLDPHKERRFTVVGSKSMATFDDMASGEKITVYDKGFDQRSTTSASTSPATGDIWSPRLPNAEPLRSSASTSSSPSGRQPPRSDRRAGFGSCGCSRGCQEQLDASRRSAATARA